MKNFKLLVSALKNTQAYRLKQITIKVHEERVIVRSKANAKLIAAAPELLDNLLRIIDRIEENNLNDMFPSAYERAKRAIKKVTE